MEPRYRRKATSHVSKEDRRMGRRQGVSFVLGFLLFVACFGVYFASQTDYVQKNWLYPYPYRETVEQYARVYGVDSSLAAGVIHAESRFNSNAQSHRGAVGLMQLMPDTAAGLGVDPYDEQQNVEGGAKYLREMLDTFGGDVRKAVAAYNAGPAAVKAYGGVPPYPETQEYVDRVLDMYK